MKISILGSGYVGLVTGTCFADAGLEVTCVDIDPGKVEKLKQGICTIYEPGLQELIARNLRLRRLHFTTDAAAALAAADLIFLAVPTPSVENPGAARPVAPDLSYVLAAAETCGRHLKRDAVIVTKSTVPVGTHRQVRDAAAKHALVPFHVASNPEFLKEGSAINDFTRPERIVIGVDHPHAQALLTRLYDPFVRSGAPILVMDPTSAEMTKYACNAFLAMKISFINEMAQLCEKTGCNIDSVRRGLIADSRIGKQFLYPGVGYGGSCFPKDVRALAHLAREMNLPADLLAAVDQVNEYQKTALFEKITARFGADLTGRTLAVWGLAFKPNTDDVRDAPSIATIQKLVAAGARVQAFDPEARETARAKLPPAVAIVENDFDALQGADALVIFTEWPEFRGPNFERIKGLLKQPVIFDGRNLFGLEQMTAAGFEYFSVGRAAVKPAG
ncbi:MAG: UDP-glucose dehydrogenase family protein [Planctomycetota bacterium]